MGQKIEPMSLPSDTLSVETIQNWWTEGLKRCGVTRINALAVPDAGACTRLAASVMDAREGLRPNADMKRSHAGYSLATPITDAMGVVLLGARNARNRWARILELTPTDGTAQLALARIDALLGAMAGVFPDWLEDQIQVRLLPWQATASFLYPKAADIWRAAGNAPTKPHGKDPVCCFLYHALAWIGCPSTGKTPSTISDFLLRSGAANLEIVEGIAAPSDLRVGG